MTTCLGKSCLFDLPYLPLVNVVYLYVCFFPFEGGISDLIVLVPDLC